ncbi:hypothetical protein BAUCODRAFT_118349 [Baudoinia panamericana UAMH 10762]|uniref:Protein EFR3 n=1 Tax=Baudoinia panamericana (strain UAMH 10762) TaxID=717646 RepID=M2NM68_BAUPA|nr:uncharacterized protein BAUCODRAFT_118349 [Baudoinia panamericana UAMH 10762]EMD00595.1 hypothetical protein BAUCODRAFT_118349 [Baudoinia panamericana UAMH 10762]
MPKTHLPAHMDSVRQKMRPKHQLLILKCYPRLPKNSAADVKPNGSELSYLLYYASTRRSKLPKIGAYLEKKTARDVYYAQSARVMVTLQIMAAILDSKVVGQASGLALIAPYIMRIISDILKNTNDISLIEASIHTWSVFCIHQDQRILAADHEYRDSYEKVVGQYAAFAQKSGAKKLGTATSPVAAHDAIRLRQTGLHAIKSVLTSDALAFESGRKLLAVTIPAILSNIRGDDGASLEHLVRLSRKNASEERDKAMTRRQSLATTRTFTGEVPTLAEADPRAAEGTTQDADALAEEEVALVALDSLKAVFSSDNRAQIRAATAALLSYLSELQYYQRPDLAGSEYAVDSWSLKVFELCTAWTPVQDRFILLVTAVEKLTHLPLKERDMIQHVLHASLIDTILRSDLNLIGLSVMDVLLGLIQHTLRILQYHVPPDTMTSQVGSSNEDFHPSTSSGSAPQPSPQRIQLLWMLKACIADLATHVYYTDQISDMISAILLRLKPNASPTVPQNPLATAAAIEEPKSAVNDLASNASLAPRERTTSTGGFFNFDIARQTALEAVKSIMTVAHSSRARTAKGVADSRNPVHISIWEGTQWLLRDPCVEVRMAYAEALVTWLELETKKSDFRIEKPASPPRKARDPSGTIARRAASNASATKDRAQNSLKKTSSSQTFLQLLHLANFENVLQFAATSKRDILMQSTLLATLLERLGLNALANGLPMIFALQDEIPGIDSPIGKVRVGTLVHGYLWAVVETFDCQGDVAGKAVMQEIARRQGHSIWVKEVEYPPLKLPIIWEQTTEEDEKADTLSQDTVLHNELKPFDDRERLVDTVLEHYQTSVVSPAPSAPGSPGRSFTLPTSLDRTASSYLTAKALVDPSLLGRAREAMVAKWSREQCLAAIASLAPRSISLNESVNEEALGRAAANAATANVIAAAAGNHRQLLTAVHSGAARNGNGGLGTPAKTLSGRPRQPAMGAISNLQTDDQYRRVSAGSERANSLAAARAPLRVEELKRVLADGGFTVLGGGVPSTKKVSFDAGDDTASDSMVEDGDMVSDDGYTPATLLGKPKGGVREVSLILEGIKVGDGGQRRVWSARPPY